MREHRSVSETRVANTYVGILVLSSVGNICADYALFFYGLSALGARPSGISWVLSAFYVGQSLGIVAIAPVLATYLDRVTKRRASLSLDALYVLILLCLSAAYRFDLLNPATIFFFSAATAALGTVHKASISFAVIHRLSDPNDPMKFVSLFMAGYHLQILAGVALSGLLYDVIGFHGCMAIGILTFALTPLVYLNVFPKTEEVPPAASGTYAQLRDGLLALRSESSLFHGAIVVALLNVASSILPSLVGILYQQSTTSYTWWTTLTICSGVLLGASLSLWAGKWSSRFRMNRVIALSTLPAVALAGAGLLTRQLWFFVALFLVNCAGAAFRNVSTAGLRTWRVSPEMMGRVNTAYMSMLYLGQAIGGALLLPVVQTNLALGSWVLVLVFASSALFSSIMLPSVRMSELLGSKR